MERMRDVTNGLRVMPIISIYTGRYVASLWWRLFHSEYLVRVEIQELPG